ncbi:MAG: hypothetical protein LBM06_04100 [Prevotellaceae bacterium]|jgi:hypothetical protein|nr:hypothetical protein [Prevotellaceae bacterium]
METIKKEIPKVAAKKVATPKKKRVSKTWEAAQRLKGSIIVYDPKFLE